MLNKKAEFEVLEQDIAQVAKALSHPARLSILRILAKEKGCMCGDIVDLLPLAQSTVSQHLKYLKDAGLIKGEVDGPKTCYCLNYEAIQNFKNSLNEIFTEIESLSFESDCC